LAATQRRVARDRQELLRANAALRAKLASPASAAAFAAAFEQASTARHGRALPSRRLAAAAAAANAAAAAARVPPTGPEPAAPAADAAFAAAAPARGAGFGDGQLSAGLPTGDTTPSARRRQALSAAASGVRARETLGGGPVGGSSGSGAALASAAAARAVWLRVEAHGGGWRACLARKLDGGGGGQVVLLEETVPLAGLACRRAGVVAAARPEPASAFAELTLVPEGGAATPRIFALLATSAAGGSSSRSDEAAAATTAEADADLAALIDLWTNAVPDALFPVRSADEAK
jgi:SWI/SNF-related matrix-associated actin-dependent regulator 1 of chromatin subfamily A